MKTMATVTLCALAALAGSAWARSNPQPAGARVGDDRVEVWFGKEQRSYALDTTRVAVYDPAETLNVAERGGGTPHAVKGWHFVPLALDQRTPDRIRALVADPRPLFGLDERAAIDNRVFVSPVLVDVNGGPMIAQPGIIVRFAKDVTPEQARQRMDAFGGVVTMERPWVSMPDAYRVTFTGHDGFSIFRAARDLSADPKVDFADPETYSTVEHHLIPNDPGFSACWGHRNVSGAYDFDMDSTDAWDVTLGSPTVRVLILDSGVQQNHPDINQVTGQDFTSEGSPGGGPFNFCDNHGTTVAGTVSAIINNNLGTVGVAPNTRVMSARVTISNLDCSGSGGTYSTTWHVNAVDWGFANGARVSNASFGVTPSGAVQSIYVATYTSSPGMVHFASTGNQGIDGVRFPASSNGVNGVGATDRFGNRAGFSNYGFGTDFVAPGVDVFTCDRTGSAGYVFGDYVSSEGTSYSSPYAAGVAALVISHNPSFTAAQVEARMQAGAVDMLPAGFDDLHGWGHVNAYAAVTGLPAPPPPAPGPFNLLYPPNNSTIQDTAPTFDWSDSNEVQSYTVVVDDNSNFSSPLINVTIGSSQLFTTNGTFAQNVTYYWRVTAQNPAGSTQSTPVSASFVIDTTPPPPCPGDLDNNGIRNTVDLVLFLGFFGTNQPPETNGDIDGNGIVNTVDLVLFLSTFGLPCPP